MKRLRLTDRGRGAVATLATLGSYATCWILAQAAPHLPAHLYLICRVATYAWAAVLVVCTAYALSLFFTVEVNPTEEVKS